MKLQEVNTILSPEERLERLKHKIIKARRAVSRGVMFLDSNFLLPPGPSLLVANTGKGKTSCIANQVFRALSSSKGLIFCILNEETEADFYIRIACMSLGFSFTDAKLGKLPVHQQQTVNQEIVRLNSRVVVADSDSWNLNSVEGVLNNIRNTYQRQDVSLIVVDYLQNINESEEDGLSGEPSFVLSKYFGTQLKELGKTATCPILIAAQINPGIGDVVSRVQNDKTFGNHCKTILELITNFDTQETEVIVQKDRFNGSTGKTYVFKFNFGKLSFICEKNSYDKGEAT